MVFQEHPMNTCALFGFYIALSLPLFDEIYLTSKVIVDEMFHIPQAKAYCDGRYDVWDTKITTLPGLYVAAKFVNLFTDCTTYSLRMFNLFLSVVNLGLIYRLLDFVYGLVCHPTNIAIQALSIAFLPPLYFFAHVFYTDTLSLTFLLLFTLSVINKSKYSVIYGICSIFTRQTNVIWILMIFTQKTFEVALKSSRVYANDKGKNAKKRSAATSYELDPKAFKRKYDTDDFLVASNFHWKNDFKYFFNWYMANDLKHMFLTFLPALLFGLFVLCNGSIVVGDKQAHTVTVHLPQLLYFLLFYGFFGLPIVLARFKNTLLFMLRNKDTVLLIAFVSFLAVHFNTLVHPYLLADNRHYTFYIWNRWFGKYPEAPYVTIPLYVFLACSFIDNITEPNCISFYLAYFTFLVPGLCLQRLLEIRYFIIPYIIARLRFPKFSIFVTIFEFVWHFAINIMYLIVFFQKEVIWEDIENIQRIIW